MCYDPLALLYYLHPDAFAHSAARTPVRLSGDVATARGWRFERCPEGEQPMAHVIEPTGVLLERYATFLRDGCAAEAACASARAERDALQRSLQRSEAERERQFAAAAAGAEANEQLQALIEEHGREGRTAAEELVEARARA